MPVNAPLVELKFAQVGRPEMLNVRVSPSGSSADGTKLYAPPTSTEFDGTPLIVGGEFEATTSIENGPSVAFALPSLTPIEILL